MTDKFIAKETKPKPTSEELIQYEKSTGFRLPEDYKDFLLNLNAYTIKNKFLDVDEILHVIHFFYPFTDGNLSLQKTNEILKEMYEGKYIIIASDEGGNSFGISLNDETYGIVYYLKADSHHTEFRRELASSFSDMADKLSSTDSFWI